MDIKLTYDKKTRMGRVLADKEIVEAVREHIKTENPDYAILKKRDVKFVSPWEYGITETGRFHPGMYLEIYNFLKKTYLYKIEIDDSLRAVVFPRLPAGNFQLPNELTLRDYQEEVIKTALKVGRGISIVGTGGGKTLIISTLVQNLLARGLKKVLIVVPDLGLVKQTYDDFNSYKSPFTYSKWTGNDELDITSQVNIVNQSLLLNRIGENDWVFDVDAVVIDEVHSVKKGNVIAGIINKIKTQHKFGFTGTLPDDDKERWGIVGAIGAVIYQKLGVELREDGFLAPVKANAIKLRYNSYLYDMKYKDIIDFITTSRFRNETIAKICNKLPKNVLILVGRIKHGEELLKVVQELCPKRRVVFIQGSVDVDTRKQVIEEMERGDDVIVIAIDKIFSVGINVKNLHYIIFGSIGKAFIKIVQTIGRGVRLHQDKKILTLYDIVDEAPYMMEHFDKRRAIYEDEKIPLTIVQLKQQ